MTIVGALHGLIENLWLMFLLDGTTRYVYIFTYEKYHRNHTFWEIRLVLFLIWEIYLLLV